MTSLPVKRSQYGGYCATSGCAYPTLPREPRRGHVMFDDVTSGSHVGHAQWYILYYYYSKKKAREPVVHAHAITSGHVPSSSGNVTSNDIISDDVTSGSTSSNTTLSVLIYYLHPGSQLWNYDAQAFLILRRYKKNYINNSTYINRTIYSFIFISVLYGLC